MTKPPQHPTDGSGNTGDVARLAEFREQLEKAKAEIRRLEHRLQEDAERLEQKVQERTRELEAVNQIATTVSRSSIWTPSSGIPGQGAESAGAPFGAIFLANEENSELTLMVEQGRRTMWSREMQVTSVGETCPGIVALRGEPLLVNDFQQASHAMGLINKYTEFKSMVGIPLESKGKVRGVLCLISRRPERFSNKDVNLLVAIGGEIGVAIENAWLYEKSYAHSKKMEELSMTDSLTGLFNRRHFYRRLKEEMARARRQKHSLSLLVVDLDNLKDYNDVLRTPAWRRGAARCRPGDTASIRQDVDGGFRYGGDEFAVILPYSDSAEAAEVAERIRGTFIDFGLNGTSLSIGQAEFDHEEQVDDFVTRADSAMYFAKNSGGNRVHKS